jgi:hypothetical protein
MNNYFNLPICSGAQQMRIAATRLVQIALYLVVLSLIVCAGEDVKSAANVEKFAIPNFIPGYALAAKTGGNCVLTHATSTIVVRVGANFYCQHSMAHKRTWRLVANIGPLMTGSDIHDIV